MNLEGESVKHPWQEFKTLVDKKTSKKCDHLSRSPDKIGKCKVDINDIFIFSALKWLAQCCKSSLSILSNGSCTDDLKQYQKSTDCDDALVVCLNEEKQINTLKKRSYYV